MHSKFSQEFIQHGPFERDLAQHLAWVEKVRLLADYTAEAVPADKAAKAIDYAEKFVTEISAYISKLV